MSVMSTGTALQEYSANNRPGKYWWWLPFSADFIFFTLFKYLWNPSFIFSLVVAPFNACTEISKVYWKVFLNITAKNSSASTTIIFGIPNTTNKFPKSHCAAWYDLIYFRPTDDPILNPFIQSKNVRILQRPSLSDMFPGSQKYINTSSNWVSDSIVWSNCCAYWDHEFTNWQCAQALMNCSTSLLTTGQKNFSSIMNEVLST